jgi:hypothetical protein
VCSAAKAQADQSFCSFAMNVYEFSSCKRYDFADGSFLIKWDNGRTEVNTITP